MENRVSVLIFAVAVTYWLYQAYRGTKNIYSLIRIHLDIRLYKKQREALK